MNKIAGYGWRPDTPDQRDHYFKCGLGKAAATQALPPSVDLRRHCPTAYNQLDIGSCTANAIAGAIEFDQIRQHSTDNTAIAIPSRLFIYYNERVIENTVKSDAGAAIRDGIKSVNSQGVCPESEWPYDTAKFSHKPPKKCYDDAMLHKAVEYQRLNQDLTEFKACLADGFPFVFGFAVYESFESDEVAATGIVNMPAADEVSIGGHAPLAVGYDDTTQRFLVRNSWGTHWGLPTVDPTKGRGYFTIPYAYLLDPNLTADIWTIRLVQ